MLLIAFGCLFLSLCAPSLVATATDVVDRNIKEAGTTTVPDYLQTTPGPFAGSYKNGELPFLAQTNQIPFLSGIPTYVPNRPLQTVLPIKNQHGKLGSVFKHLGNYSPNQPSPGFGADEFPLPEGANISQVHLVHRHGSRYPGAYAKLDKWAEKIKANAHQFSGKMRFLHDGWTYRLGSEMLTANGRKELFESGILHYFNYGQLYDPSTKIIARTTTQYRMLQSATNFLSGFFGLDWSQNATLVVMIESKGFNNSLSGETNCPNKSKAYKAGNEATGQWKETYLKKATRRLRKYTGDYEWTVEDSANAQDMCAYETVALGSSQFCLLFNWKEWQGYDYASDLGFHAVGGFASPIGRAIGVSYVAEFIARVEGHVVDVPPGATQVNMTLGTDPNIFPTNQSLYLDFSHDTTILGILTAFGLRQFAQYLPTNGPPKEQRVKVSHMVPFAGRLAIEIITAPAPVAEKRRSRKGPWKAKQVSQYGTTLPRKETRYVHFVLNQRTVPLGESFEACGDRDDGWCELETFIKIQRENIERAQWEYSCFGDYPDPKYGEVEDGVPPGNDGEKLRKQS